MLTGSKVEKVHTPSQHGKFSLGKKVG